MRKGNMDVDLIFKIAAIGILVVVLMILLREISALFDLAKALFNF